MPRRPRVIFAGIALHLTQRGVDRSLTFLADEDYAYYRWALRQAALESECAVHAYALMPNHVHLLVTPAHAAGIARMMRSIGARYVRYFNRRYRRTGVLWEGRFRAAPVRSTDYLMNCYRYIELNPVRAGLAAGAAAWEWSSFGRNANGAEDSLVTRHPDYLGLGAHDEDRRLAYRVLFAKPLTPADLSHLRAELRGRPNVFPTPYRQAMAAMLEVESAAGGDPLEAA
jgi:putative transposase